MHVNAVIFSMQFMRFKGMVFFLLIYLCVRALHHKCIIITREEKKGEMQFRKVISSRVYQLSRKIFERIGFTRRPRVFFQQGKALRIRIVPHFPEAPAALGSERKKKHPRRGAF